MALRVTPPKSGCLWRSVDMQASALRHARGLIMESRAPTPFEPLIWLADNQLNG